MVCQKEGFAEVTALHSNQLNCIYRTNDAPIANTPKCSTKPNMNSYKTNAMIYSTIVAMGGFLFGLDAALISGTIDYITAEFSLTPEQLGTAVSAPALGVLVALPFAGYICNQFGRKKAILLIAILYVISAICSSLAPSYWTLVAARFLGGLAFSSISLASMYIGEIAPPKLRGKLVSMTQINIVIGLSSAYFVNYLINHWATSGAPWVVNMGLDTSTWRWMLGSEVPFALLWFGLLLFIPESPSWFVFQHRDEDAKQTLRKLMPEDEIEGHVAEVRESIHKNTDDHSIKAQLRGIFGKPMRLTFVIALTIAIAQQSTGINAVLFYAQTIFKQLGIGSDAAFVQAIWVGLTSIVFTVMGLLLVDRLGRRPLIIWGMVWIIASLGICAYAFNNARYFVNEETIAAMESDEQNVLIDASRLQSIAGVEHTSDIEFKQAIRDTLGTEDANKHMGTILDASIQINAKLVLFGILSFIAAFHFSVGPVMWVLFSEIFPVSLRGIAIPFFTIVTSLTSWLVQFFFPRQLESMGMTSVFLFYAGTVFAGLVILFFTLKETKNMSIEEIEKTLRTKATTS
ncbi:sugar porter family MFS transporter [Rhodopirellula sp. SWK7]|uniref:sugar porter family MFS transporter n=1 Tax=Rhodopirellula sp. SWK7 TaxID=595460 RepID=UPI000A06AFCD|nr:sugar porter family MFS transporter [Rhodopirellula sp. SWK7]